jgi:tRNA modification GTPase
VAGDTIFAVSSGRPPAAIAVIRVSGPGASGAVEALTGTLPPPRQAGLRAVRDAGGALLDRVLMLVFPAPRSATGEDLIELHCHGGRAVVAAIEGALAAAGLRRAAPGEFTRRAMLNGRIDLAEAQGLADLLEAETETQRRAAIDAADGRVSALVRGWMARLTGYAAAVEASLDFAEEDDVAGEGDDGLAVVRSGMIAVAGEIADVLAAPSVERLRDGVRVVIAGPPNAGKSTLFNQLCERDAAIVSPVAGTTRDRLEAAVQRDGIAYLLIDTAGLRDSDDVVEVEGVARAEQAAATADVLLWLSDEAPPREDAIWLHGRADLPGRSVLPGGAAMAISALDPLSATRVWDAVSVAAVPLLGSDQVALHVYQRRECEEAGALLAQPAGDPLLMGEALRRARMALGRITGESATESMLDALFGRFCIGK